MILLNLFLSFAQIGLFSVGGGYAAMPLIQHQTVDFHSWLSLTQFTDLITIAEMTPGPIAVNSATFVGLRVAGVFGAIISTLGVIFPSLIIVLLLAHLYYKYHELSLIQSVLSSLRPAVVALICSAGLSILILAVFNSKHINFAADIDYLSIILFILALFVLRKTKFSPILVMLSCGIVYTLAHSILNF